MSPRPTKNPNKSLTRPRPTTARRPVLEGLLGAGLLHGLILAGALITFQRSFDLSETHTVPVELVTIADKTNVRAMAPPEPDLPKPVVPMPDAPTPPPVPAIAAEPAPDIPPPPKLKVIPDTPEPKQDISALLNKLTAPAAPAKNVKAGPRTIQGVGNSNLMTADIADALQSQIARCWSPPVGAPNANELVVEYDMQLNQDGSVASLALLPSSVSAVARSPYTRASAEAASRAIYQCQPYHLPPAQYNQWREINPFHFDPRQMMGQ